MSQAQEAKAGLAPEVPVYMARVLMPSPLGPIGVELTGTCVTLLRIAPSEPDLSTFIPLHQIDGSDFLDEVFGRLSEYFAGARRKIELAIDLGPCGASPQVRRILKETARIPYGKTRTYQVLAEAAHVPEGPSRVVAVLQENPIPILIPCHRAVADLQQIGDYVGGSERKRWLLELEQQGVEWV
jgi:methylated-DNA-[protein]-cysteine S-methyltransferase